MVRCPKCEGKLIWDIEAQVLRCAVCGDTVKASVVAAEERLILESKSSGEYTGTEYPNPEDLIPIEDRGVSVTIHTCSVCGGKIVADYDEILTKCVLCGADADFSDQTVSVHRPDRLIPFKITKEQCIERYRELAGRNIYLPSELVRRSREDGFRPLYMPFRTFDFKRDSDCRFLGTVADRVYGGSVILTDYTVKGHVKSSFKGLSETAMKCMLTSVGKQIVPFSEIESVPYEECYLNGYCAGIPDSDSEEAGRKLGRVETELVLDEAAKEFRDIGFDREKTKAKLMETDDERIMTEQINMFPVWILSQRKGKRVNYAMVNGQTGKVSADLPASKWKVSFFSALAALPFAFLFYFSDKMSPFFLSLFAVWAALVMSWIHMEDVKDIFQRKTGLALPGGYSGRWVSSVILAYGGAVLMLWRVSPWAEEADYYGYPDSLWVYVLFCILCAVVIVFCILEKQNRYQAVEDIADQFVLYLLFGVCVVISLAILCGASGILLYLLGAAAIVTDVFAAILSVDTHNVLDSVKPKLLPAKGGEEK